MADEVIELKAIGEKLDGLHTTVTQKIDSATKELNEKVASEVKAQTEAIEKKSAEQFKVLQDETEKIRKEWADTQAKQGTQFANGKEEIKSFAQAFADQIQAQEDDFNKFLRKEKKSFELEIGKQWETEKKAVGDMSLAINYTGGTQFLAGTAPGIRANPNRKFHIRDIPELPKGTTTGTRFDYLKENGAGEGAPTPVAEGGTKPQVDFDLVEASAPVETLAALVRITNKMYNNVPGMVSFLQTRLLERLLRVEDDQLINGNGTSPNLSGIADAGNFTAAAAAQTLPKISQLVYAISQLEELDRTADAVLLRNSDFWSIVLTAASGSGEFDLPGIVTYTGGQLRIAGIPVYRTTAMTADQFIVGDFGMGAMLLQKSAPRIEFFREDGSNVWTNKTTVRIEEEIAFPIFGSDYFIYDDFTV